MSFHEPAQAGGPGPRPPRSTPIPGGDAHAFGSPLPGNWGAGAPPTPTEFASGQDAPAPPPGFRGGPGPYAAPGTFGAPGMTMPGMGMPYVVPRRRRSFGGVLLLLLVFAGPLVGVGIGVWAFFKARDAVTQADDLSNPNLSAKDRDALGLPDGIDTLFEAGAAPAVVAAFQEEIGGPATRFTRVMFYTDYAFAIAQDPNVPTHLDEYQWRAAKVGEPSPEQNDPDLDRKLFGSDDVNWNTIAALTSAAPSLLGVEGGKISHVIVDRTGSVDSTMVVARVYVTGPRDSGYLEANALTGEVVRSF